MNTDEFKKKFSKHVSYVNGNIIEYKNQKTFNCDESGTVDTQINEYIKTHKLQNKNIITCDACI